MNRGFRLLTGWLLALLALAGTSGPPERVGWSPLEMGIPIAPEPVVIDGLPHLVHELVLTNPGPAAVRLLRIEVLRGGSRAPLAGYGEGEIVSVLGRPESGPDSDRRIVAPGGRAVAYLWIPLGTEVEAPDSIAHRVTFRDPAGNGAVVTVEGGSIQVRDGSAQPSLGPPLRGGPWVAVYDPGLERGHRRVRIDRAGRFKIPARFAVDWMRVDARGRLAPGDPARAADHYGYGADVLAVADATVAAVRDGVAERTFLSRTSHGLALAAGNYVTLDLGNGRFISYEHLKTGSVRVAAGDRVQRGQVIARLGYSGDGSSPHLHTHVSDGPAPLEGEGVPWVLEQFELLGSYPSLAAFAAVSPWAPRDPAAASRRQRELPGPNMVVRFPD